MQCLVTGNCFCNIWKRSRKTSFTCTCETCGATFQSKQALKKHISWNHEIHEKAPCNYCGVIVQNMKMHVENRHENSFESCWHCDFQTRRSFLMKKHVQNLHTETNMKTCEFCQGILKELNVVKVKVLIKGNQKNATNVENYSQQRTISVII